MKNNWKMVFGVALVIGGALSLLASSSPDGLEKVAQMQGFLDNGKQLFKAFIPDYAMPGIVNEKLATSLAGIVGTIAVFLILWCAGKCLYRVEPRERGL